MEYTESVCVEGRIRLERKLNAPSRCVAVLLEGVNGLALPVRRARVVVSSDGGDVLFTGYLATEPVRMYAGEGFAGAAYRARVTAVSDEWLLDKQGSGARQSGEICLALDGRSLLARLTARAQNGGSGLTVPTTGASARAVGAFAPDHTQPWSANAGAAAGATYAAYRAVAGEVLLQPAGATAHALNDADGTLDVHALQISELRELANDVTLSGEEEPAAYFSETFAGDGTTAVFTLSETAFRSKHAAVLDDDFEETVFDPALWSAGDPGSYLTLSSAGLTMNGGTGFDGATRLTALDAVEMAGTMVVELSAVTLGAACDGMLGGLYAGTPVLANCVAGFRVRQSVSGTGSVTQIVPVLNGVEAGSVFTPEATHRYTLRLRLHCVEMQRVHQRYYCMMDGVVQTFGDAGGIAAPLDAVFEVVDQGAASNTPATVLYDSAAGGAAGNPLLDAAATCVFTAVNGAQMFGAVGRVRISRPGSVWVTSTLPSGDSQTRLMGVAGEGVDCVVEYGALNRLMFLAGRVPVAGERVTVRYRGRRRSVARLMDTASVAAEGAGAVAGVSRWLGRVLQPAARTTVDCESAALAILALATSRTAAVSGSYRLANPREDIWPGDVLDVTSDGVSSSLLVRSVTLEDGGAEPELVRYVVSFANDWATQLADGMGVRLTEAIAEDAVLPAAAATAPDVVLRNLQQLTVTSVTATSVTLDTGIAPPAGGGFEVRRRDWDFGPGNDLDLVLRSPVRTFSIPRAAQVERFYVRMYDASVPPVYSRFSGAAILHAPVN